MNDLLRRQDLVENPSTRVPVCLCLDVSGSMNRIVGGVTRNTGRTQVIDGQTWNIVEGGTTALQEMIEGVRTFYSELKNDDVARYSAEVCIVTFGGNGAQVVVDFANLDRQSEEDFANLEASGETPMGEAVNKALDCLEARKNEYKESGVDYFQPWLVLMTDGEPNGSQAEFERATRRTSELANARKLSIFPIGIGMEANLNSLAKFSPKRTPLRMKHMNFKGFFEWLSKSVAKTSQSMPGDLIPLDPPLGGWDIL